MLRDIRFHVLAGSIDDAKRRLSEERRTWRQEAFDRFAEALALVDDEDEPNADEAVGSTDSEALEQALQRVPEGRDRELVRDSTLLPAHVFLTGDKGIRKARQDFESLGLLIVSPQELLEELAACGALFVLFDRRFGVWPAPDTGRLAHLVSLLPEDR